MNNLDIFCFTSIARTKSFSATARELRISQQAVSKHIRSLEAELGYPLFFRNRSFLELTKAGVYMLEYFSKRDCLVNQMKQEFDTDHSADMLKIGCSQWIGNPSWFHQSIRQFREDHPQTALFLQDLDAQEALQAVESEKIDVFLSSRYMASHLPVSWNHIPVRREPLYIVGSRDISLQNTHREFYPFYTASAGEESENAMRKRACLTCGRLGFTPHSIICCPDMGTVILNILLNDGITLGAFPPERGNIQNYVFQKTELEIEIVMSFPHHSRNPHRAEFLEFLTGGQMHE